MDTKLGGDFLNSSATNTTLGGSSLSGTNSVFRQLEEESVKILARLAQEHTSSENIGRELAKALQESLGPLTTQNQELSSRINSILLAAPVARRVGETAALYDKDISTATLQEIVRSVITAYDVLGPTKLEQVANQQILPSMEAGAISPAASGRAFAQTSAQTAFTTRPAETARKFMYGQLPAEYLAYGGEAVARIGPHIRGELLSSRKLLHSAEELPTGESLKGFLAQDYSDKVAKVRTYLETLQNTFEKTTEELKKAISSGDAKKAADLRRALGNLSQEMVETTKTLEEAEKDSEEKRKRSAQELMSALSPVGSHAEQALRNPVVGLLKESFKVGATTTEAVASLLGTGDTKNKDGGGLFKTIGELSAVKWASNKLAPLAKSARGLFSTGRGAAAAAEGGAALLGEGAAAEGGAALLGEGAAAAGSIALSEVLLPAIVVGATAYGGYKLWQHVQNRRHAPQSLSDTIGTTRFSNTRTTPTDIFSNQLEKASSNLQDYNTHLKATTETTQEFKLSMGKLALAAGTFGVGTQLPVVGNTIKKVGGAAIAVGAGVLAGGVNFGMGAIDIGQNYLSNYWQGTTGLNMRQYLGISGGAQNVSSYLGGGVLGTQALRMGFGINDITRGYEVMQRGMPTGGLNSQQMVHLLDENAKIARALGIRLEESLQMTTTMRQTFGTASPRQMGGYIAALGADRTGNFESAFSKAVAQGFLDASRQMMMQGVAPESAAAGFGALRNIFMAPEQPSYLRTLAENNPQFITSLSTTFSGKLRAGAAGNDPWTLGLALRSGMSFEQMARGGPEATMQMLDQIMQEFPLGLMSKGGKLSGTARELLSKYAAEMGQNPDIFIGYAEATLRGDTERAKQQFRGAFGRGAAWEGSLTAGGLQRSPMYEENMRILNQTTARLAQTTETVMGTITKINTSLLKFTDKVLQSGELIYAGTVKTMENIGQFFGVKFESGEGFGVKQNPTKPNIRVIHNKEELDDFVLDAKASEIKQKFQDSYQNGFLTLPKSAPNTTTILEINGQVNIRQKAPSFLPEDNQ